ncbi:ATPase (plasmid) [Anabaenopsis circularis NIES-21]|uniref:ATPase n=1 Tax=Anabaenopsis circularis NIES-21 TaxID=1085406 RepID=A0A1Z4GRK9_9CYAN|nr:ATPase [Anabaenopsis circularis NIES-21]
MENWLHGNLTVAANEKLTRFKEYAVSHPQLVQVDQILMRAIREPAGFAHVLVYGPSGVGKTTMIRQITRRLSGTSGTSITGNQAQYPLLLLETRPPDGGAFNRADYYRTALKLLGEPFYERRMLVDIDSEQTWEKKGRGRTKTAQFNDSPELRQALEETITRRGVKAVILDEAQHLMKIGTGASAGKLLDQLDWIKSMTNVTGVLHILIGTYELLNLRNLSARRGLDIHFPRYLFQHEQDRQDFQGVLLALLKQVPLQVEIPVFMQNWCYFYERSVGCVGVLKDWLIRAVAAALHDGSDTLSLERLQDHAMTLAQCERMAVDAVEGEQKLDYMESRREHLWHLLQMGTGSTSSLPPVSNAVTATELPVENTPKKTTRRKRQKEETTQSVTSTASEETVVQPTPKKRQSRKKTQPDPSPQIETSVETVSVVSGEPTEAIVIEPAPKKKSTRRVGERKPKRDPVGS